VVWRLREDGGDAFDSTAEGAGDAKSRVGYVSLCGQQQAAK
jgi:hypothetical protein